MWGKKGPPCGPPLYRPYISARPTGPPTAPILGSEKRTIYGLNPFFRPRFIPIFPSISYHFSRPIYFRQKGTKIRAEDTKLWEKGMKEALAREVCYGLISFLALNRFPIFSIPPRLWLEKIWKKEAICKRGTISRIRRY